MLEWIGLIPLLGLTGNWRGYRMGGKAIGDHKMSTDLKKKFEAARASGNMDQAKAIADKAQASKDAKAAPRTEESVLSEMKKIKDKMSKDMAEWSMFTSEKSKTQIASDAQKRIFGLMDKHGISESKMIESGILAKPKKGKKDKTSKTKEESKSTPKRPASFKEDKKAFEASRTSLSKATNRQEAIRALDQMAGKGMALAREDSNRTRIGNADVTDFLLPAVAAESFSASLQKGMSPTNARKAAEKSVSEAIAKHNKDGGKRRPSFDTSSSSLSLSDNAGKYVAPLYNSFIRATANNP